MNQLKFKAQSFALNKYETVLDCLLRNSQAIPYACKAGMCQACLVRAVDCQATEESRKWIKPALQARGYTLACQWVPDADVEAALPGVEDFSVAVRILQLELLNAQVLRVVLEPRDSGSMFSCRAGQYLTLINPAGIARSYSLANDPEVDGYLELHIANTAHGSFTQWLFSSAAAGDLLHLRGPAGDCYYAENDAGDHPLLLAGTGTGLAPLYGIVRDALRKGHTEPITLLHGGRTLAQLYLVDALQALAGTHANFRYIPCTIEDSHRADMQTGTVEQVLESQLDLKALSQTRVYLCGAPDFVHALRKRLFLKGARAANIHCDPFTERKVVPSDKASGNISGIVSKKEQA